MHALILVAGTGLSDRAAAGWAIQSQVVLRYAKPRQKAWLVERSGAFGRDTLDRTETQVQQEISTIQVG